MGRLLSGTIPNLISGVSQQPWNVRLPTQAEEQVNCYPSVVDFLKRRPASTHVARLFTAAEAPGTNAALHHINRDDNEQYVVVITNGQLAVFDLAGKRKTVNNSGAAYLTHTAPQPPMKFLTINDYTFILNTERTVAMLPDVVPARAPEAAVFVKQASYNTTYTLFLNGQGYSYTTADGVAPADQPADSLSSEEITNALVAQIPKDVFAVNVMASTIWIRRYDGADFEVKTADSRSNTHITAVKNRVQTFSDLLTVCMHGFTVEVTGNAASAFDNYFVRFEADSGTGMGKGVWKETVKPGVPYKLNPATMPHALIRQADGTFTFGPLEWGERGCGDEDNAPAPSFVGRSLSGLFLYRNRLSFLSWENVIMSKVGQFFSFFPSTVTTMVDDDPVDVAASHTRPTALEHASVFSGGLLLFTRDAQFALEHDSVLSSATASIKPVTEFEASLKAEPVTSGKTVFFATDRGKFGGVREYLTLPDQTDQNDAADVSAHIPRYIAGGIHRLICSTNEDVLFVLSEVDRTQVWLYKYFWNGAEKIQSAWSRWKMEGLVVSGFVRNTTLFLLMKYADGLYLERFEFEPGHTDEGAAFEFCLDRKVTQAAVSIAYDAEKKISTITLPYEINNTLPMAVSRQGALFTSLEKTGDTSFTVRGDARNTPLYVGIPYTSAYTFSTFALRDRDSGNNAVISGRLQLRSVSLSCANTGMLRVRVTPQFREPSVYTFTARELGHGTNTIGQLPLYTGTVKVPVLSLNSQVSVTVESDSFLPFALVNATWEGFYNTRAQRM